MKTSKMSALAEPLGTDEIQFHPDRARQLHQGLTIGFLEVEQIDMSLDEADIVELANGLTVAWAEEEELLALTRATVGDPLQTGFKSGAAVGLCN